MHSEKIIILNNFLKPQDKGSTRDDVNFWGRYRCSTGPAFDFFFFFYKSKANCTVINCTIYVQLLMEHQ